MIVSEEQKATANYLIDFIDTTTGVQLELKEGHIAENLTRIDKEKTQNIKALNHLPLFHSDTCNHPFYLH